jgi:hypothetical protein
VASAASAVRGLVRRSVAVGAGAGVAAGVVAVVAVGGGVVGVAVVAVGGGLVGVAVGGADGGVAVDLARDAVGLGSLRERRLAVTGSTLPNRGPPHERGRGLACRSFVGLR